MSVQSTRHQVCCRDNFDLQLYEWEHVVRFSEISTPPLLSEICPGFFFSQWSALFDWSQRSQCYFLSGTFEQNRQWRTCCWKLPPAKSYICNFLSRELIWYQTLLPLLTSFSSASSSASVLWCAATRKNFWIQKYLPVMPELGLNKKLQHNHLRNRLTCGTWNIIRWIWSVDIFSIS